MNTLNEMIDQMFGLPASSYRVEEDNEKYLLRVAAWGYKKDELDIKTEGDFLIIRGKKETEGKFNAGINNKYRLPRGIRRKGIKAQLENGILQVQLPKGSDTKEFEIEIE